MIARARAKDAHAQMHTRTVPGAGADKKILDQVRKAARSQRMHVCTYIIYADVEI